MSEEKDGAFGDCPTCKKYIAVCECQPKDWFDHIESLESRLKQTEKGYEYERSCHDQRMKEISDLKSRLRESETVLQAWQSVFGTSQLTHAQARLEAAEQRLTQAEAELQRVNQHAFQREESLKKRLQLMGEKLKEWQCPNPNKQSIHHEVIYCDECGKPQETDKTFALEKLEKRLSHLMDVAGKMAGIIKNLLHPWCEVTHGHLPVGKDDAELALAEWDGIKKDGGK